MAVAADEPPFGNRVMGVLAELGDFRPVAGTAKRGLIRLQQLAGHFCGGEDLFFQEAVIVFLSGGCRGFAGVDLVAGDAGHAASGMRLMVPLSRGHDILVAPQTDRVGVGGLHIGEGDVVATLLVLVGFSRTMAPFAPFPVERKGGIGAESGVA